MLTHAEWYLILAGDNPEALEVASHLQRTDVHLVVFNKSDEPCLLLLTSIRLSAICKSPVLLLYHKEPQHMEAGALTNPDSAVLF